MNDINFLPAHYLMRMHRAARLRRHALLGVALLLGIAGWAFVAHQRTEGLRDYAAALDSQVQAIRGQSAEVARLQAQRVGLIESVRIHRELAMSIAPTQVLAAIGNAMPQPLSLTELSMNARRPRPTSAAELRSSQTASRRKAAPIRDAEPDVLRISIVGLSPDDMHVANFVGNLGETRLFANVKMAYSRPVEVANVTGREFRVDMEVPLDREYRVRELTQGVADAH